jgi:transposase
MKILSQELPEELANDFIYQQDNASIHIVKDTEKWFKDTGITATEWPLNSPDMNPIEHIQRYRKSTRKITTIEPRLHRNFLNFFTTTPLRLFKFRESGEETLF